MENYMGFGEEAEVLDELESMTLSEICTPFSEWSQAEKDEWNSWFFVN